MDLVLQPEYACNQRQSNFRWCVVEGNAVIFWIVLSCWVDAIKNNNAWITFDRPEQRECMHVMCY